MENKHPIESLMQSTLENLKDMIDVNTVIGDGIESPDGSFILPISKVSFGFASGGSEIPKSKDDKFPFGGGSGSGVSVKPVAFLVIKDDTVRILPVDQNNTYDRIVDTIPQVIDMLKNHLCKNKKSTYEKNSNEEDNIEQ